MGIRVIVLLGIVSIGVLWGGLAVSQAPDELTIKLERAVHFLSPEGADTVLNPGLYGVAQAEDEKFIKVTAVDRGERSETFTIKAEAGTHEEKVSAPQALTVTQEDDLFHVVLVMPDGKTLDAVGNFRRMRTRAPRSMEPLQPQQLREFTRRPAPPVPSAPVMMLPGEILLDAGRIVPYTPLSGWVDLHTHPMINLAFGGKLVHGGVDIGSLLPGDNTCAGPKRAQSMAHALEDDKPSHGGWNLFSYPCGDEIRKQIIHEFQKGQGALVTTSPAFGYPVFNQWPKWNDITHQKMWFEWIKRAHDGGLRVMVALATNNETLGDMTRGNGDATADDKTSADLQVAEIKSFVGRHNDFMEIAFGPADINRIVRANKIAVVVGVEIDNIGNFNKLPAVMITNPTPVMPLLISNEIQRLYDAGVRYIFPIHVIDNIFGGTAIYEDIFNMSNYRETFDHHFWSIECATAEDNIGHTYKGTSEFLRSLVAWVKIGVDPLRQSAPAPLCPRGHRNARGLTEYRKIAIKEMMKRGMIVDIDHMSQKSVDQTLDIAETFGYPVVSGHAAIRGMTGGNAENSRTPLQLQRLSKLHGMFGLGSDGTSAYKWSHLYQKAMNNMGYMNPDPTKATYLNGAVSFGTDLNGLVKAPEPPPPGSNRVVYDAAFPMSRSIGFIGNSFFPKSWNYNTEGVAHYGMLADFVKDVRTAPAGNQDTPGPGSIVGGSSLAEGAPRGIAGTELVDQHLFRSADYFWHMWERIEAQKVNVH